MKNTKFDEVKNDILKTILDTKYDDIDKEVIKLNIVYNLNFLFTDEDSYNKGINLLQKNSGRNLTLGNGNHR